MGTLPSKETGRAATFSLRPKRVVAWIGAATLIAISVSVCLYFHMARRDAEFRTAYHNIKVGVTTEADVISAFGTPQDMGTTVLTSEDAPRWGLVPRADNRPIVLTVKHCYYDDEKYFELHFDEKNVVVHLSGLLPTPPRSVWKRFIRMYLWW